MIRLGMGRFYTQRGMNYFVWDGCAGQYFRVKPSVSDLSCNKHYRYNRDLVVLILAEVLVTKRPEDPFHSPHKYNQLPIKPPTLSLASLALLLSALLASLKSGGLSIPNSALNSSTSRSNCSSQ